MSLAATGDWHKGGLMYSETSYITHYCIKGLEVPFIYGRLGHGMNVESSKPLVAKVVYGCLLYTSDGAASD